MQERGCESQFNFSSQWSFLNLFNETKWKYSCRTDTKHLHNYPDSRNASMNLAAIYLLIINRHSVPNSCCCPANPTLCSEEGPSWPGSSWKRCELSQQRDNSEPTHYQGWFCMALLIKYELKATSVIILISLSKTFLFFSDIFLCKFLFTVAQSRSLMKWVGKLTGHMRKMSCLWKSQLTIALPRKSSTCQISIARGQQYPRWSQTAALQIN